MPPIISSVLEGSGGALLLATGTAALGMVIENRRIVDLPLTSGEDAATRVSV
jgi:hypothetical protein